MAADPASSHEHIIENIDIGGPSMVRSAAKNHARVTVVCDPQDYGRVLDELAQRGDTTPETRAELAAKAFAHTAAYDAAISGYLSSRDKDGNRARFPTYLTLAARARVRPALRREPAPGGRLLRRARRAPPGSLARAESLGAGGKELSFNNLVDVDAALDAVREFERPAAVVVKHTNPCGVAVAASLAEAYRAAREADAVSAFGGIVALNRRGRRGDREGPRRDVRRVRRRAVLRARGARGAPREEEPAPPGDRRLARSRPRRR